MSGGSLNYLGSQILTQSEGDLEGAARMLREHGHPAAAARTEGVLEALRLAQSIHDEMADVFRACDRRGSGDDGPEAVARAVEAWRAKRPAPRDVGTPDEQIKRLEDDLRDTRERLREQHDLHRQGQEEIGGDFWEEGTRVAGERVRMCKARLEAARDMRAACGVAAVEQIVPEGSSVVVTLPGKVDAAAVTIGFKGSEDDRKVRAQAERLFKTWAQSLGLPVRIDLFGSETTGAWMAVARASLDAMVSAAAHVERAAHEKGVADGLKMRDEAAQIAIDNLRATMQEQIDNLRADLVKACVREDLLKLGEESLRRAKAILIGARGGAS